MNRMKRQKDMTLKDEFPKTVGAHMLLEKSGEITPKRMKGRSQSKNNTQLGMGLVIEAILHRNLECSVQFSSVIQSCSNFVIP